MNPRYVTMSFTLAVITFSQAFADTDEAQVSWKYLVQRTITKKDNINGKKEVHTDRAFVYYGAGAKEVGGQIETVPQVVYVDEKLDRIPTATYYGQAILPRRGAEKFELWSSLPEDIGSDPTSSVPVSIVANNFPLLPLKPKRKLSEGFHWNSTIYMCFAVSKLWFPATINHRVTGYAQTMGRRCAIIDYTVFGEFKSADHPERFTEQKRQKLRAKYNIKGQGTAYFDPVEEIIVEKEQTIYWTSFGEKLSRLEDGSVDWVPTVDEERVVTIKVSLQPEEEAAVETEDEVKEPSLPASSGWPSLSYVLIAVAIGIGIVCLILLLKKTAGSSKEKE